MNIIKNNLEKRIIQLEEKFISTHKVLIIMMNKDDANCESAKQRVMRENKIKELPNDCVIFTINIYHKIQA